MEKCDEYRDADIYLHHSISPEPDAGSISYSAHFHDRFELYYFIGGSGSMAVEGVSTRMEPGRCLLLCPGETHAMHVDASMPYERMALLFRDTIFTGELSPLGDSLRNRQRALCRDDDGFIRTCLTQIFHTPVENRRCAVLVSLGAILHHLSDADTLPPDEDGGDPLVGEIIRYVNTHLGDHWDLDTLASALYRDKSYLNRRFRATVGTTIWDYTTKKRLIAARQNMFLGGSVSAGFTGSGFSDYSSFWRQYRSLFGLSPKDDLTAYRRQRENS
ncbi:MAG: helix-turn-helix transcriptional regulator [Clostridia bacterium]|nr:helix-turn-helix transcriptional regulator [Clostridia bacterium]